MRDTFVTAFRIGERFIHQHIQRHTNARSPSHPTAPALAARPAGSLARNRRPSVATRPIAFIERPGAYRIGVVGRRRKRGRRHPPRLLHRTRPRRRLAVDLPRRARAWRLVSARVFLVKLAHHHRVLLHADWYLLLVLRREKYSCRSAPQGYFLRGAARCAITASLQSNPPNRPVEPGSYKSQRPYRRVQMYTTRLLFIRHSGASRNPGFRSTVWIPACAGMTKVCTSNTLA